MNRARCLRPSATQFGRKVADRMLGFVYWLVLGLIDNILFEWACIGYLWPEEGPKRSQFMLEEELRYLQGDSGRVDWSTNRPNSRHVWPGSGITAM